MAELSSSNVFGNFSISLDLNVGGDLNLLGDSIVAPGHLTIDASRVGIGTSSPSDALDVSGNVRWSGTLNAGTVPWARLSGVPATALSDTTYSAGTGLSLSGTTFNIDNPFNPSGLYSGLRAQATTKGDVGLSGIPNTNGSTANYLRGDGSWVTPPNTTYAAGNGISLSGTTFSVAGGAGLTQQASGLAVDNTVVRTSGNQSISGNKTFNDNVSISDGSGTRLQVGHPSDNNPAILVGRRSGNPSIKALNSSDWVIIDGGRIGLNYWQDDDVIIANGGGNVGIGTTSPSDALDVSGNVRWTGTLNAGTVPWARLSGVPATALSDTTYSAGTGISLSGTTFNVNNPFNPSGTYLELRAQATTKGDVGLSGIPNTNGSTANYLRGDGSWVTPPNTNTTYSAGNGISLSGTTFSVAGGAGLTQQSSGLAVDSTVVRTSGNQIRTSGLLELQDSSFANQLRIHRTGGSNYSAIQYFSNGTEVGKCGFTGSGAFIIRNGASSSDNWTITNGSLTAGTVPVARVSGTLPVSNGGTGRNTLTNNTVLVGNGTSAVSLLSRLGIDTRTEFPVEDHTHKWGDITGTLSNQTDLQNALDDKLETADLAPYTQRAVAETITSPWNFTGGLTVNGNGVLATSIIGSGAFNLPTNALLSADDRTLSGNWNWVGALSVDDYAVVVTNDSRLTNSREWTATTVSQPEAEAGTETTRRAWTAQRVRQAVAAWWNTVSTLFGRNLVNSADAAAGRTTLGLGTAATANTGDFAPSSHNHTAANITDFNTSLNLGSSQNLNWAVDYRHIERVKVFRQDNVYLNPESFPYSVVWKFTQESQLDNPPGIGAWAHVMQVQGFAGHGAHYPSYQMCFRNGAISVRQSASYTLWEQWAELVQNNGMYYENAYVGWAQNATELLKSVLAGDGLTGGGQLTANRTLNVDNTVIRTTGNQNLGGVKTFTTAMRVTGTTKAAGYFYAGNTNPTNITRLNYDGNLHTRDTFATSDRELKQNIESLDPSECLDVVSDLRPVSFEWKEDNEPDHGLIAQEVVEVAPHFAPDGTSVNYAKLTTYLIGAIQSQQKTINNLLQRIEALENGT